MQSLISILCADEYAAHLIALLMVTAAHTHQEYRGAVMLPLSIVEK